MWPACQKSYVGRWLLVQDFPLNSILLFMEPGGDDDADDCEIAISMEMDVNTDGA